MLDNAGIGCVRGLPEDLHSTEISASLTASTSLLPPSFSAPQMESSTAPPTHRSQASGSAAVLPLPMSQVERIAKRFLAQNHRGHEGMRLDRIAKEALHRAVNVFVLYAATLAEEEREARLLQAQVQHQTHQQQKPGKRKDVVLQSAKTVSQSRKITALDVEHAMIYAGFSRFLLSDDDQNDESSEDEAENNQSSKHRHSASSSSKSSVGWKRKR